MTSLGGTGGWSRLRLTVKLWPVAGKSVRVKIWGNRIASTGSSAGLMLSSATFSCFSTNTSRRPFPWLRASATDATRAGSSFSSRMDFRTASPMHRSLPRSGSWPWRRRKKFNCLIVKDSGIRVLRSLNSRIGQDRILTRHSGGFFAPSCKGLSSELISIRNSSKPPRASWASAGRRDTMGDRIKRKTIGPIRRGFIVGFPPARRDCDGSSEILIIPDKLLVA